MTTRFFTPIILLASFMFVTAPLMIVVVGAIVGFIVISMYLPMFMIYELIE